MAVDMFLKIEGIKGESRDDKHQNQIEIESYSFGLTQSGTFAFGGGAGAGKVQFQDFHFTKKIDKSSPILFLKCATGEHIKEATLFARRAGEGQQEFLQIKMNDILVSSYQTGGSSGGDLPTDQFSLNYVKIEYAYTQFDETGKEGETFKAGWDLKLNKKI
jgi:type VI secretion system secreted protein Hcp